METTVLICPLPHFIYLRGTILLLVPLLLLQLLLRSSIAISSNAKHDKGRNITAVTEILHDPKYLIPLE